MMAQTLGSQPFQSATARFPRYGKSATPILLEKKPLTVRSRKLVEERDPRFIRGRDLFWPGDAVQDLLLLIPAVVHEVFREELVGFEIQPHQAAQDLRGEVVVPVFACAEIQPVVDELRNAGLRCAPATLIGGNDQIQSTWTVRH